MKPINEDFRLAGGMRTRFATWLIAAAAFSFTTSSSHAALIDNGGGLIYDTVLDITWAQPDTPRDWDQANTWAALLTLGGATEWRQPYISVAAGAGPFTGDPVDCSTASEVACRDNELGYMFYQNLSGTFGQNILTSGDPDLALFPTLESEFYWFGTEFDSDDAWYFNFNQGNQQIFDQTNQINSWAVHAGNVVPVPAAVWLFGSGLLGLLGLARRKQA